MTANLTLINKTSYQVPFPEEHIWLGKQIQVLSDFQSVTTITMSNIVLTTTGDQIDIKNIVGQYMKVNDIIMLIGSSRNGEVYLAEYHITGAPTFFPNNTTPEYIEIPVWSDTLLGKYVPPDNDPIQFRWMPETSQVHTHVHEDIDGRDLPDQHPIDGVTGLQDALNEKTSEGHIHPPIPLTDEFSKTVYNDIYTNSISPVSGSGGIEFLGAIESSQTSTSDGIISIPIPAAVQHNDFMIAFLVVQDCDAIVLNPSEINYDPNSANSPVSTTPFTQIGTNVEIGTTGPDSLQHQIFVNIANQSGTSFIAPYKDLQLTLPAGTPPGKPLRAVILAYRGIDTSMPIKAIENGGASDSVTVPGGLMDTNNLMTLAVYSHFTQNSTDDMPRYAYTIPWTAARWPDPMQMSPTIRTINYYFGEFYRSSDTASPYPTVYMQTYPAIRVFPIKAVGLVILRSAYSAATKADVIKIGGDLDMQGNTIYDLADPQSSDLTSATSKKYVDGSIWKRAGVRALADQHISINPAPASPVIDGVAVVDGETVLLTKQNDPRENGIYKVGTSLWERSVDFQYNWQLRIGSTVYVEDGTKYASQCFVLTKLNDVKKNIDWTNTTIPTFTWEQGAGIGSGGGGYEVMWGITEPDKSRIPTDSPHTLLWADPTIMA